MVRRKNGSRPYQVIRELLSSASPLRGNSLMVEHSLAKAEVEGSNPSFRSRLRRLVVTSGVHKPIGASSKQPPLRTYLTNNKKGASQTLLLTSCWLFRRCALARFRFSAGFFKYPINNKDNKVGVITISS